MNIKNNINILLQTLPPTCILIAISKNQSIERINEAYSAGHKVFGENKVQELVPKYEALPKDIEWHMVGHLQRNKIKYIAPFVHLIHSVDSFKLLEEINTQGTKINRVVSCLLQVHIAKEETKYGFSEQEVVSLIQSPELKNLDHIYICGLMGMATLTDDQDQIRKEFKGLKILFEKLKKSTLPPNTQMKELSMGMSSDHKIAVEEGSTMVRIGTAIFGERNYQN